VLLGIRGDDHDRRRVGHISEALFAFPQGVFCPSMLLYQYRERHDWNADKNQKKLNGKNTVRVIEYEDRVACGSRCYRKQAHYRQRTGRTRWPEADGCPEQETHRDVVMEIQNARVL